RAFGHGCKAAELHQQRAVALERNHVPFRLGDRDTKRNGNSQAHAAEHVEILWALSACPQVEIRIADAANDGFVAFELTDHQLCQLETVHHLRIVAADWSGCLGVHRYPSNTLPPVRSGERMKVTGACVAIACLMERSMMNAASS